MKYDRVFNSILLGVLVLLLSVIIYHPITSLGFASMDDDWMLLGFKMVHPPSFNISYLFKLFTTFNSIQYSPVNTLYYYAIYLINGYDPYWYHLGGWLIHLINTALVYLFIKRILNLFNNPSASIIACICCVLWVIHPLNVESVIWISSSKVLLYTMFMLIALLSMLRFALTKNISYYLISLICFIAACLCKEQAVVFPVIMLTFFLIFYSSKSELSIKYWLLASIPFFAISIAMGVVTIVAQQQAYGPYEPASLYGFFDRVIFSFYCLCFYLLNAFLPISLHYQYNYPIKPNETIPIIYYSFPIAFLVIIVFFGFFIKKHSARHLYFFWFLFFLINIFLCIQIVPMRRPAIMADRYMYFSLIGLLVLLIYFVNDSLKSLKNKNYELVKNIAYGFGLIYATSLIIISSQMAINWQSHNLIIK